MIAVFRAHPLLLAPLLIAGVLARPLAATLAAPPAQASPSSWQWNDAPEPFVPARTADAAARDRLQAETLFVTARSLENEGRAAEALRRYMRAARLDPQAAAIVGEIVPLAQELGRTDVAARYAARSAALPEASPLLLRRLGVYLTNAGQWPEAAKLYEWAVAARGRAKPDAADVLLAMELGRLDQLIERYEKAAKCFDLVLAAIDDPDAYQLDARIREILVGDPLLTYGLIGECYLQADRADDALAAFRKGQALAPNEALWQYRQATVLAHRGDWAAALAALEKSFAAKLPGKDEAPAELLVEALNKLGRGAEALARLETLRAADPANAALSAVLAVQYAQAGRTDDAAAAYRRALQQSPSLSAYRGLIGLLRRSRQVAPLLAAIGDAVGRTDQFEVLGDDGAAIARDAALMDALIAAARAAAPGASGSPARQADYGRCLAIALLAQQAQRHEVAAEFFRRAIAADGKKAGELYLLWGLGLLADERGGEAAAVFAESIQRGVPPEDDARLRFYGAAALALDGQTDAALAMARQAAGAVPSSARFAARVGWIEYYAKRYDAARRTYQQVIEQFDQDHSSPENREAVREARQVLSSLCERDGRADEAEEWLQQVLDEYPGEAGALNDLGYLWADKGKNLHRALPMIEEAVAAEPDNRAYRDSLGWVLYRLGRYDEACVELRKAVAPKAAAEAETAAEPAADADDATVWDHLGDACRQAGRLDEARAAWNRAAAAFETAKEPQKAAATRQKLAEAGDAAVATPKGGGMEPNAETGNNSR